MLVTSREKVFKRNVKSATPWFWLSSILVSGPILCQKQSVGPVEVEQPCNVQCVKAVCANVVYGSGILVSKMINISILRLDHNNCRASVNSVGGWGAGPVIHRSRSQKHSSGRGVSCPLSWENSALSNIKCIWKGTLNKNRSIESGG